MDNNFAFGDILRRSRNEQNLTLNELSDKTNGEITASYINRLETKKKTNPGFEVVCELCEALNLDLREVLQSFGYESLIKEYDQDATFSVEDLIRLYKVKLPGSLEQQKGYSLNKRLINTKEKEQLIQLINEIFDYSFAEESNAVEKLSSIIKQLYRLRELEQEYLLNTKTFEVHSIDITYTVECDLNKMDIPDFKVWKEEIKIAVANVDSSFRDYPRGIITLTIGSQEWIIEKQGSHLKLLFKKTDIVSI